MAAREPRFAVRPFRQLRVEGRGLVFVVDSAAFAELGDASLAVATFLGTRSVATESEVAIALGPRFGNEAIGEAFDEMTRLGVLVPEEVAASGRASADRVGVRPGFSSLTLLVANDCNLRCDYCYADHGRYGGTPRQMSPETARRLVDRVFDEAGDRKLVHLTFFGGEPLLNVPAVEAAAERAEARARDSGRLLRMGLTTNGTLLGDEAAKLLREHRITLSVSLDGPPDVNDPIRTYADGRGSHATVVENVLRTGVRCVARVTLTRRCTDVVGIVRHLLGVGFAEVGIAPVATGDPRHDLGPNDMDALLEGFRALARDLVDEAVAGGSLPFSNLRAMLEQIHAGEVRPVPCGAGSELVAADADGDLFACHRMIGRDDFRVGTLEGGIDEQRRWRFLRENHPRTRTRCSGCWARFLCGGGCHHLAHVLGPSEHPRELPRHFCDFLRAHFELGLETYARLSAIAPDYLARLETKAHACGPLADR